jgi:hypothetical protein
MTGLQQLRLWLAHSAIRGAIALMPERPRNVWLMHYGWKVEQAWGDDWEIRDT